MIVQTQSRWAGQNHNFFLHLNGGLNCGGGGRFVPVFLFFPLLPPVSSIEQVSLVFLSVAFNRFALLLFQFTFSQAMIPTLF